MKVTPQLNAEVLHSRLKIRSLSSESALNRNHPTAKSFFEGLSLRPGRIRHHAAHLITSGVLAGSLLLATPPTPTIAHFSPLPVPSVQNDISPSQFAPTPTQSLARTLTSIVVSDGDWLLTKDQEMQISQSILHNFGLQAKAELDGHRLNNSYGRMGAEQHLPRYPGDTAEQHGTLVEKGITPGKGAWGYFAYSKQALTPELEQTEKWYVAVQTLYLPDWNTNTKELSKWYKHRRVVVANPANGKLVVAAVADAGPAKFTGKHFGGSPEVMQYLGINTGMQNHPVVLFFLDDPDKKIPLGPVEYNVAKGEKFLAKGI